MNTRKANLRTRFWVEAVLASATGILFAVTFVWHDWLEAFGFDPDNHNGSAEWLIVAVLALVSVAFAAAARIEWRRAADASA